MLPSLSLAALLQSRLSEILKSEEANGSSLHIYTVGDFIVAFEKSAYWLSRIVPECGTAVMRFASLPFPVIMASTAASDVSRVKSLFASDGEHEGRMTFRTDEIPRDKYMKWHDEKAFEGEEVRI